MIMNPTCHHKHEQRIRLINEKRSVLFLSLSSFRIHLNVNRCPSPRSTSISSLFILPAFAVDPFERSFNVIRWWSATAHCEHIPLDSLNSVLLISDIIIISIITNIITVSNIIISIIIIIIVMVSFRFQFQCERTIDWNSQIQRSTDGNKQTQSFQWFHYPMFLSCP